MRLESKKWLGGSYFSWCLNCIVDVSSWNDVHHRWNAGWFEGFDLHAAYHGWFGCHDDCMCWWCWSIPQYRVQTDRWPARYLHSVVLQREHCFCYLHASHYSGESHQPYVIGGGLLGSKVMIKLTFRYRCHQRVVSAILQGSGNCWPCQSRNFVHHCATESSTGCSAGFPGTSWPVHYHQFVHVSRSLGSGCWWYFPVVAVGYLFLCERCSTMAGWLLTTT